MADATLLATLAPALALASVGCEITPTSGSGTYTSRVVVRPQRDEVADFPELRATRGAERPAYQLHFAQADVVGRPVRGDRITTAAGVTFQITDAQSDRLAIRWLCTGFVVEAPASDLLEPSVYMPCGLGFSTAGSLLS